MSQLPSMNEEMADDIAFIDSWVNRTAYGRLATSRRFMDDFEAYMEANRLYERVVLTPRPQTQTQPLTLRMIGLGLSEEKISVNLCVMKRKVDGKCEGEEVHSCTICLGEYEENEMIGTVECGHEFHAECIKGWLLCKNVCPLCRATALTI